ncbi:hypothetical protein Tco_0592152, partial [Tanacetum coccineum]
MVRSTPSQSILSNNVTPITTSQKNMSKKEQRDTPQLELKEPTAIDKIGPSRNNEEREIEWLDIEEPLDLVDTCEESVYESL